ncbi:MAG: hypothetical protein JXB38_02330, partial [Anaerolineales bacterium]|nr:hypothetical protein [Anaerolineales bacterium]
MAYFDASDDPDELEDYGIEEALFVVATDTWGMPRGDLVTADPQANYNTLQLPYRSAFDFDYGTIFTGFLDTEFAYIDVDDSPALLPNAVSEETKLAVWGAEEPALADCQDAAFSKDTLMLADLPVGTFICMQTSWGGHGYLRIDGLIPDPHSAGENLLALSYRLWTANETAVVHSPLRAIVRGFEGEVGTDLDTVAGDGAADVNFRLEDEFVAVLPANGASLGLWGSTYPSYQDCAAITLSNENPVLVPRQPYLEYEAGGAFLCYRTSEGNLGRMFFLDEIGGQFVFDAETWAGP